MLVQRQVYQPQSYYQRATDNLHHELDNTLGQIIIMAHVAGHASGKDVPLSPLSIYCN